jgi:hypothetical protein
MFTEFNHIKLDMDEIGVINITVNKAADRTANGYLAIFITYLGMILINLLFGPSVKR